MIQYKEEKRDLPLHTHRCYWQAHMHAHTWLACSPVESTERVEEVEGRSPVAVSVDLIIHL